MNHSSADISAVQRIGIVPRILDVLCKTTGMRFTAVARVTEDRWMTCASRDELGFGLGPGDELQIETTICNDIRKSDAPVVIDDVSQDPIYCRHVAPHKYGFRSYISVPILKPNGEFFGTLCAIDPEPRPLRATGAEDMFRLFAELIGEHLQAEERLDASESALVDERRLAEVREQFIAVLGHDLRNPLAAVGAGVNMLRQRSAEAREDPILVLMETSLKRMEALIEDVLDFARGRLGEGLVISRTENRGLDIALRQVVEETRAAHPARDLRLETDIRAPVFCDEARVAQLASNLVSNALHHGAVEGPVVVKARGDEKSFVLSVTNSGDPIPPEKMAHLFEPFFRSGEAGRSAGLGLGLYISSQIARAHGGELRAASDERETSFSFVMPNSP